MRGAVFTTIGTFGAIRITPAYAGSRLDHIIVAHDKTDHPRVCGEQYYTTSLTYCQAGSPPRMRGAGSKEYIIPALPRITPAYAGSSCKFSMSGIAEKDHPRVCGEQSRSSSLRSYSTGSPPRMRGAGSIPSFLQEDKRITPAYAGSRKCWR